MAASTKPPGLRPSQLGVAQALFTGIQAEQNSSVRAAPYNQPPPDVRNQLTGITGYKVTDDDGMSSRPLTDENRVNAQRTVVRARQGLQTLGEFTTADPYDKVVQTMRSVIGENGVVDGIGKVQVGPDSPFWDYAARKKALEFENEFKGFVYNQIDLSTPESRELWEKRFPDFTEALRSGLYKNRMLRARLEDIGLYGARNEEDMWLLYLQEKGLADKEKYLEDQEGWGQQGIQGYRQRPMGERQTSFAPPALQSFGEYFRSLIGWGGEFATNSEGDFELDNVAGPGQAGGIVPVAAGQPNPVAVQARRARRRRGRNLV